MVHVERLEGSSIKIELQIKSENELRSGVLKKLFKGLIIGFISRIEKEIGKG